MFKRKKNIFKAYYLNQYLIIIVVFVLLILISIPLAKNVSKKYEIDSEVRALEEEIIGLQKKNLEMEKLINEHSTSDFVEGIARLNLGLKKEGEEVVVIKRSENNDIVEVSSSEIEFAGEQEDSNPKKWLKYFLRK